MSKKLLREYFELCPEGRCPVDVLTESEKRKVMNEGAVYLVGVCQRAGVKNGNGRIYNKETLGREVQKYQNAINDRRSLGELDHPDDSVINLKNASHMVTDIWVDGKAVHGKVKVLDTPAGKTLRSLVDSGVKLGISSRALGSVNEQNGNNVVQDDLQLICFDFVSEPSTPNAFMMKESKNLESNIFNESDKINRLLNEVLFDE